MGKTVVFDIEANGLTPTEIYCLVAKDVHTGEVHEFRRCNIDPGPLLRFADTVDCWIGHYILGYDLVQLGRLVQPWVERTKHSRKIDTLVLSRLLDFNIAGGHSLEAWGERLGIKKEHADIEDWSVFTEDMVVRCRSDVEINYALWKKFEKYVNAPKWKSSIEVEHFIAERCQELHENGFHFELDKAKELWYTIGIELEGLDDHLISAFPPKVRCVREVTPRLTKFGTFNRNDFRWTDSDLTDFNGGPFTIISYEPFNPASTSQIVERLNEAGWKPTEKTKGHIKAIRDKDKEKIAKFAITGWTVSEENLNTLPSTEPQELWLNKCLIKLPNSGGSTTAIVTLARRKLEDVGVERLTTPIPELLKTDNYAESITFLSKTMSEWLPNGTDAATFVEQQLHLWSITATPTETFVDCSAPDAILGWSGLKNTESLRRSISLTQAAKTLAHRIMLGSRRSTLTEWINSYNSQTQRIHGSFNGIGAWSGRMSHTNPNTGNIAREDSLFGAEMRSMWSSPEGSFLVGVDAESIQLRVLAHYIDDEKFTQSLLTGKKEDGTDPHSLNKIALGSACGSRNIAKTFIYAWLLGAGVGKVAQILECSYDSASEAVSNFIEFYPGLKHVKKNIIPEDARRGYFQGFDGRWVKIKGEDFNSKQHFCLAGYLQNGEVTVMKHAMRIWYPKLISMGVPFKIVNFVHDEWQTEVPSYDAGLIVGETQADAIRQAGEELSLRCPMAGSVLSGHGGIAIGRNWLDTH